MKFTYAEKNSGAREKIHKKTNRILPAALPFIAVLLITAGFLTGITSAAAVSGNSEVVVYQNTHLGVEVAGITPNPARPGEDLLIKINVENNGDNPAENVRIGIEEIYPFIFKYSTSGAYGSGTNTQRNFSN